jgi:hypothetical protein
MVFVVWVNFICKNSIVFEFTPYFLKNQKHAIRFEVSLPLVQFILCGVILSLLYLQRQEYQNILDNEKMRKEVHDVFCKPPRIISYPLTTMPPTMLPTTFHR